MQVAFLGHFIS
jgi:hypothetical protein